MRDGIMYNNTSVTDARVNNTEIIQAGLKILFCIITRELIIIQNNIFNPACIISVLLTRASVTDVLLYIIQFRMKNIIMYYYEFLLYYGGIIK